MRMIIMMIMARANNKWTSCFRERFLMLLHQLAQNMLRQRHIPSISVV